MESRELMTVKVFLRNESLMWTRTLLWSFEEIKNCLFGWCTLTTFVHYKRTMKYLNKWRRRSRHFHFKNMELSENTGELILHTWVQNTKQDVKTLHSISLPILFSSNCMNMINQISVVYICLLKQFLLSPFWIIEVMPIQRETVVPKDFLEAPSKGVDTVNGAECPAHNIVYHFRWSEVFCSWCFLQPKGVCRLHSRTVRYSGFGTCRRFTITLIL